MTDIDFHVGCRDCLQGDGVIHSYSIKDMNIMDIMQETEYEIMVMVEKWRVEDNRSCPFCGSYNMEVLNLETYSGPLYDFNSISKRCTEKNLNMFAFNIDKRLDFINHKYGGDKILDKRFVKSAIQELIKILRSKENSFFVSHAMGNFFVNITGKSSAFKKEMRIERFRSSGFERNEILDAIFQFADNNDIKL